MSYISLPFGLVRKEKKIKPDLPKNCGAIQYIKRSPYASKEDPNFQNSIIDIANDRSDLKNFCWLQVIMEEIFRKTLTLFFQMKNLIRLLYVEH